MVNVIYDVSEQSSIYVQYSNQLHSSKLEKHTIQRLELPYNILLDTFDLPRRNVEKFIQNSKSVEHRPRPQGMKTWKWNADK